MIKSHFLYFMDVVGIISFTLSGFFAGVRKKLDLLGIFLSSFVTALGGGIVRDVIVGKKPYSLIDPIPSLIVTVVVLILIVFKIYSKYEKVQQHNFFVIGDSIGLCAFSISGALIGIEAGFSVYGVVILSIITAVGGGIIRDTMVNEIPFIMTQDFYASISIIISVLLIISSKFYTLNLLVVFTIFLTGLFLRLLAYKKGWKLPSF